jgi:hypothetical protein
VHAKFGQHHVKTGNRGGRAKHFAAEDCIPEELLGVLRKDPGAEEPAIVLVAEVAGDGERLLLFKTSGATTGAPAVEPGRKSMLVSG